MGPSTLGPAAVARIPAAVKPAYTAEAAAGDDTFARAVFTDRVMGGPARWVAAETSAGKPSWLYYFSYVGSRFRPGKTRASHADEIQYAWEYSRQPDAHEHGERRGPGHGDLDARLLGQFRQDERPEVRARGLAGLYAGQGPTDGVRSLERRADQLPQAPKLDAEQASTLPTLALGKWPPPRLSSRVRGTRRPDP